MGVLSVGLLAHLSLTGVGHAFVRQVDESRLALQAARAQIEEMRSRNFGTLFVAFDEDDSNDPANAPGPHFDVPGLSPSPADPDGRVGRIRFPVRVPAGGGDPVLREDVAVPELGLPFDLDGDGVIDDAPKDTTYVHLPVVVEIRFTGARGERILRVPSWITPLR